jgi:bifunctional polynucleotide phosphatase/kinase
MNSLLKLTKGNVLRKSKIAAFDLDHTIIKPRGSRTFPKDKDDWVLIEGIKERIKYLQNDFMIVIFTNQGSKNFSRNDFSEKLDNIHIALGVPFQVYCSTGHDIYRKPCRGMWDLFMEDNFEKDKGNPEYSFFVGDMETDHKFAINANINFYHIFTFLTNLNFLDPNYLDPNYPTPIHPLACINKETDKQPYLILPEVLTVIILIGSPGSTKSTFCERHHEYYKIVCQDELKTKKKVMDTYERYLKVGDNIIIDRQNKSIEERKELIDLAKKYNYITKIVWFDYDKALCEHLCAYREIKTGKHIPKIVVNSYYKNLEPPSIHEVGEIIKYEFVFRNEDPLILQYLL